MLPRTSNAGITTVDAVFVWMSGERQGRLNQWKTARNCSSQQEPLLLAADIRIKKNYCHSTSSWYSDRGGTQSVRGSGVRGITLRPRRFIQGKANERAKSSDDRVHVSISASRSLSLSLCAARAPRPVGGTYDGWTKTASIAMYCCKNTKLALSSESVCAKHRENVHTSNGRRTRTMTDDLRRPPVGRSAKAKQAAAIVRRSS